MCPKVPRTITRPRLERNILQTQIANPRLFLASSAAAALVGLDRDQLRYRARTRAGHPQPVRLNARVWAWDAAALAAFYSVIFE